MSLRPRNRQRKHRDGRPLVAQRQERRLMLEPLERRDLLSTVSLLLESSGGTTLQVDDQSPLDTAAAVGVVQFQGSIDNFSINFTTGSSIKDPAESKLEFSSLNVTSAAPGTLTIRLTDTDFQLTPGTTVANLTSLVGGVTNGTLSFQSYVDNTNAPFGTGTASTGLQGPFGPGSYNNTVDASFAPANPFSMTAVAVVSLPGNGSVQSFSANTIVTPEAVADTASLGNYVWFDLDLDGVQDGNEPAVQGATVNLYADANQDGVPDGAAVGTTSTNSSGFYEFTGLAPGSYVVQFIAPNGEKFTAANQGGDDELDSDANVATGLSPTVTLVSGQNDPTIDAGLLPIDLSIGKSVSNSAPEVGSTVTFTVQLANAAGLSDATNVQVGDVLPAGMTLVANSSSVSQGSFNEATLVWTVGTVVSGGPALTLTFDATVDTGGTKINFAQVTAAPHQPDIDSTPGNGTAPTPVEDDEASASLTPPASLGNYVWFDLDLDGVQDGNEPGVSGATVNLYADANQDGVPDGAAVGTTSTNSSGFYEFTGLAPGSYVVQFVAPNGEKFTGANQGGDDELDSDANVATGLSPTVTLVSGQNDPTIDAGLLPIDLSLSKSVSNSAPEVGSTVTFTVQLVNAAGLSDATNVQVGDVLPAGMTLVANSSSVSQGSFNEATLVWTVGTVVSGGPALTLVFDATVDTGGTKINFAQVTAAPNQPDIDSTPGNGTAPTPVEDDEASASLTPPASLGNYVWFDMDLDGVQDGNEPAVQGATVNLYADANQDGVPDGAAVGTTSTNSSGFYEFTGLAPGSYVVEFVSPNGEKFTAANQGGDDELDSDANVATGLSPTVTLVSGQNDPTIDAGLLPIDLSLSKSVDDTTPEVGDTVTFTVQLVNAAGLSDATNVQVADVLPAGMTLVANSSSVSQGSFNEATLVWTVGTVVSGGPALTLTFDATVDTGGTKINFAQVTAAPNQPDIDSTPGNGTAPTPVEDDEASASLTPPALAIVIDKYTRVDANPIDIEKLVRVEHPGVTGNVCTTLGKPTAMTFRYTPSTLLVTSQPVPSKASILVNTGLDTDGTSYVIVSSQSSNPNASTAFFAGTVSVGETFTATGGFGSNTYIYFYDSQGGPLLQQVGYHTSCSAPITLGDQALSAELVGYSGQTGTAEQPSLGPGLADSDADLPSGPEAVPGDTVVFTFVVTNPIPNTQLGNVAVTDQLVAPAAGTPFQPESVEVQVGGQSYNVGDTDQDHRLDAGETWLFTATLKVTSDTPPAQYANLATVVGTPVDDDDLPLGSPVMDADPAHFVVQPPSGFEGNVCTVLGKPVALTFRYEPSSTVATGQATDKALILVDNGLDDDGVSYVIVSDQADATQALNGSGLRFFSGNVAVGAEFEANNATGSFRAATYIHFFDDASGGLLQSSTYHTSCSQPIQLGDQVGNVTLVAYSGVSGSAALPEPNDPGPGFILPGLQAGQIDNPFNPANLGYDADTAPGPIARIGLDRLVFTYQVTNSGNMDLTITELVDDNETPGDPSDDVNLLDGPVLVSDGAGNFFNYGDVNQDGRFNPGETWYYQASSRPTQVGQHTNVGSVQAATEGGQEVAGSDPSNHFVNPLLFEKLVATPVTASSGDVCETYGKVQSLTFQYIPGDSVETSQAADKAYILLDNGPDDDDVAYVIVTDQANAASALSGSGLRYFAGEVPVDGVFVASNAAGSFRAATYVHFFDDASGSLLQTLTYHTSCSQPIQLGDVVGNVTLVGYAGETGSASMEVGLGDPADTPTGPHFVLGDTVVFNFVITNTSSGPHAVGLTGIEVTDSVLGQIGPGGVGQFVAKGNGDDVLDPGETWILTASQTATALGQQMNLGTVTVAGTTAASFPAPLEASDPAYHLVESLKFFVVDKDADATFRYTENVNPIDQYKLQTANSTPRGATSDATGEFLWVVDKNKRVYIYSHAGLQVGAWEADGLGKEAEGIATNGTHIWIVDREKKKVSFFENAAARDGNGDLVRTSGKVKPKSTFNLAAANTNPKGLTTDGVSLWVVDDQSGAERVFKYTVGGQLLGRWEIANPELEKPRGLTIDPAGGTSIWIVDDETDAIYQFDNATSRISGSAVASQVFGLASGNTRPEGIADPPPRAVRRVDQSTFEPGTRNLAAAAALATSRGPDGFHGTVWETSDRSHAWRPDQELGASALQRAASLSRELPTLNGRLATPATTPALSAGTNARLLDKLYGDERQWGGHQLLEELLAELAGARAGDANQASPLDSDGTK